jgi:hypothetical protein
VTWHRSPSSEVLALTRTYILTAMAEPAYVEPDEHGDFHLLVDGERRTFRVVHDEHGRPEFLPVIDYPSLPSENYVDSSPELQALLAGHDDAAAV